MSSALRTDFLQQLYDQHMKQRKFVKGSPQEFVRQSRSHCDWVGFVIALDHPGISVMPRFGVRIDEVHKEAEAVFGKALVGYSNTTATFARSSTELLGGDLGLDYIEIEDDACLPVAFERIEDRISRAETVLWSRDWSLDQVLREISETCVLENALVRTVSVWRLQGIGPTQVLTQIREWLREREIEESSVEHYLEHLKQ